MIKDAGGFDMEYWPIVGLVEGQTTETRELFFDTVQGQPKQFRSNHSDEIRVMARIVSAEGVNGESLLYLYGPGSGFGGSPDTTEDGFRDISIVPIDFPNITGTSLVEVYVEAKTSTLGVDRGVVTCSSSSGQPAPWRS